MADRKSFLLRLDERTFLALKRWADDDLRSINAQVEFLLRHSLEQTGRLRREASDPAIGNASGAPESDPK
ncbi:MAG: hypothetical protein JJE39_11390 [Vicinamibacteria bacterium]|nr:hypothetical protein [Vicinamibacteria bacterium]